MLDHLETGGGEEIVERYDGFIIATDGPADYFAPFDEWPQVEQQAMDFVQGRVLDVGCGAGRGALELQRRGHEVVALGCDVHGDQGRHASALRWVRYRRPAATGSSRPNCQVLQCRPRRHRTDLGSSASRGRCCSRHRARRAAA